MTVEQREYRNSVEWVYRIHSGRTGAHPQPIQVRYFKAIYKCERCDRMWESYGRENPMFYEKCPFWWCGNPPILIKLIRGVSYGKLIKVEVDIYHTGK